MELSKTTLAIFAIVAASGLIWTLAVESADAWHTIFESKKLCVNFMKDVNGNTTSEAQAMCNKVIPH